MSTELFQMGDFPLHSGEHSDWKIECDNLSDQEMDLFALMIARRFFFHRVYSVPTGGDRLQRALAKYCSVYQPSNEEIFSILIVDDVITTGQSLEDRKREVMALDDTKGRDWKHIRIHGIALFSRYKQPHGCRFDAPILGWIYPIFSLWS